MIGMRHSNDDGGMILGNDDDSDISSSSSAAGGGGGISTYTPWTCDEITPDLCPLDEYKGEMSVRGGLKVRYRKYTSTRNNATSSLLPKLPIVMLHGGPGFTHNYMLPLKQQACYGRDVYFYDQCGCGDSSLPNNTTSVKDNYPWLFDPYYYATEELPQLLQHWNLTQYHLIGNSWGTALAQLFCVEWRKQNN